MNTHLPVTILQLLDTERIVEVLGIFRVDSTGKYLSEVLTLLIVLFCDFARNLVGSIFYILWIFVWQTILCEDGVHLHIIVTLLSENINHFADRTLIFLIRPFDDANDSLVIRFAAFQFAAWYDDVMGKDIARCHQVGNIFIHLQSSHEAIFSSFQNLIDLCFLNMILAACQESKFHSVAVESTHRVTFGNEDRFLTSLRDYRVFTI